MLWPLNNGNNIVWPPQALPQITETPNPSRPLPPGFPEGVAATVALSPSGCPLRPPWFPPWAGSPAARAMAPLGLLPIVTPFSILLQDVEGAAHEISSPHPWGVPLLDCKHQCPQFCFQGLMETQDAVISFGFLFIQLSLLPYPLPYRLGVIA